ncbi:hypothetical protein HWB79_gp119 [Streptomyces phage LukeCage]|jgi:hypothetical protein|uniref:Uncharacterized protein n=1 Tax=Streptomyces phage LukeCage TaxID=2283304 RepID=A0A345MGL1_9CAUD|nr:hypothetical protein HWB79_gp119 [Streptomyces phage LukeCage]AXH69692.1 hypothetical protein SEA_LUKECAGE_205 [Streptomyces phage LukeCage]
MSAGLRTVDIFDEMRAKSKGEYVETVNGFEIWDVGTHGHSTYMLFKRRGKQMFMSTGSFSPLSYAQRLARETKL